MVMLVYGFDFLPCCGETTFFKRRLAANYVNFGPFSVNVLVTSKKGWGCGQTGLERTTIPHLPIASPPFLVRFLLLCVPPFLCQSLPFVVCLLASVVLDCLAFLVLACFFSLQHRFFSLCNSCVSGNVACCTVFFVFVL